MSRAVAAPLIIRHRTKIAPRMLPSPGYKSWQTLARSSRRPQNRHDSHPRSHPPMSPPPPARPQAAVVTGASGGIGSAIALELARQGADVLVHGARSKKQADHVAAEIRALGQQAQVLLADLSD